MCFYFCFYFYNVKSKNKRYEKIKFSNLLLLTVLAVFACSRHEEEMSTESTKTSRLKRNDLNSNRIYANSTVDSISRNSLVSSKWSILL